MYPHTPENASRAQYARDAVHADFKPRARSLAREPDFRDHPPRHARSPWRRRRQAPERLDTVAARIVSRL